MPLSTILLDVVRSDGRFGGSHYLAVLRVNPVHPYEAPISFPRRFVIGADQISMPISLSLSTFGRRHIHDGLAIMDGRNHPPCGHSGTICHLPDVP
jgi:hypothetical protein